jgi:glutamyl-tRNA synthetase
MLYPAAMPGTPTNANTVTRFAPSPTGHLHVGGARSALFCWAFARREGGRFMVRIEDTDQARSSEESARGILEDLAWLGITWDDGPVLEVRQSAMGDGQSARGVVIGGSSRAVGPFFQAQRVPIYNAYIEHLVRLGRAYPAFESNEELEARRKAVVALKQNYKYQRPDDITPGQFNKARWERAQAGERHVVRFVMPEEAIVVADEVLGDVRTAGGEVDDFVIRKADGFPTYHLAVVVDDELMGVTHVMRAQEHLINTPKHVALQRALTRLRDDRDALSPAGDAFRTPVYAHMPLIFNADGSKMSKRDKAKAARKHLKELMAKDASATPATVAQRAALSEGVVSAFIAGESDAVETASAIASAYAIALPEIEVWDYRASGYLPEVLTNYLALLGWSPGLKNPDGTDVDKFDLDFLAKHFSIERIGKTNARFDRVKLLAFNADAIAKLGDQEFITRWLGWLSTYAPQVHSGLAGPYSQQQLLWLAQAVKPRAKTLADAHKSVAFILLADDAVVLDPPAVQRGLAGQAAPVNKQDPPTGLTGRDVLVAMRQALADVPDWEPANIDSAIASLAQAKGVSLGSAATGLRIALTGSTVSPGLGHCCAILGRERTLARVDRCLAQA